MKFNKLFLALILGLVAFDSSDCVRKSRRGGQGQKTRDQHWVRKEQTPAEAPPSTPPRTPQKQASCTAETPQRTSEGHLRTKSILTGGPDSGCTLFLPTIPPGNGPHGAWSTHNTPVKGSYSPADKSKSSNRRVNFSSTAVSHIASRSLFNVPGAEGCLCGISTCDGHQQEKAWSEARQRDPRFAAAETFNRYLNKLQSLQRCVHKKEQALEWIRLMRFAFIFSELQFLKERRQDLEPEDCELLDEQFRIFRQSDDVDGKPQPSPIIFIMKNMDYGFATDLNHLIELFLNEGCFCFSFIGCHKTISVRFVKNTGMVIGKDEQTMTALDFLNHACAEAKNWMNQPALEGPLGDLIPVRPNHQICA